MADDEALSAHSSSLTEDHLADVSEEQLANQVQNLSYAFRNFIIPLSF